MNEGTERKETIAVIGAGLSGLVTIKELVEQGHEVVCYEKSGAIGGVFSGTTAYDSLMLTVSNYFMAYSDFMPYEEKIQFWTCAEYVDYLNKYAEHFELLKHIRFHSTLDKVKENEAGKLALTISDKDGQKKNLVVDRLAICTGQFQFPNIPDIPGMDAFEGKILHSSEYKNTELLSDLRNKTVLCLGFGESAADVVTEIASIAKKTVVSIRRYHMFAPKYVDKKTESGSSLIDVMQSRWWHSLPSRVKAALVRTGMKHLAHKFPEEKELRLMTDHVLASKDEPGMVVTKTGRIFEGVIKYGLEMQVDGISHIAGNRVTFNSGKQASFDAIVLCTGYKFAPVFLEAEDQISNIREYYLQMFHPKFQDKIAFIGIARPQQGGVPLIAELQARYFALLCSGKRNLPKDIKALAMKDAERWSQEFYVTPDVFGLVNGLRYNELLAELIGCRPEKPNLLTAPKKYFKYWFAHIWPSQYRTKGPGASREASDMWVKAPYATPVTLVARMIGFVLMPIFKLASLFPISNKWKWRPAFDKNYLHSDNKEDSNASHK